MDIVVFLVALLPFAFAALLGLLLPMLLLGSYNSFGVGLAVVAVTSVVDNLMISQPILRIGLTLYPPDLPMVIVGLAAALRWTLRDDVPRRHPGWVVLALLFCVDLAIGLARHGTSAGVQGRQDFYAVAAATYAMSFPITAPRVRQVVTALVAMAFAGVAIACYRWTVYYLPIKSLLPPAGVYNVLGASRVVYSNHALIIAQVVVLGLFFSKGQGGALRLARALSPVLLAATVVLQHRSVWLAGMVGVLLSLLLVRAQRAPLWQQLALLPIVASVALAPLFLSESIFQDVRTSAASAAAGEGTVNARLDNWKATLQKWRGDGPRAIVMGTELGSDTTRYVKNEQGKTLAITFYAHNHYVSMLTNYGVIGFAALLWVLAYVVRGLWRLSGQGGDDAPPSALLLIVVATQLAYYVGYGEDYAQYFVLGVAMAWVAGHPRAAPAVAARGRLGAWGRPRGT